MHSILNAVQSTALRMPRLGMEFCNLSYSARPQERLLFAPYQLVPLQRPVAIVELQTPQT
jgi:hypothetical protein